MSGWTLTLKQAPALRVDLRGVTPAALAAGAERVQVGHGRDLVALAEFFSLEPRADDALVFAADLARFDRVGWQMAAGRIVVEGDVGDYAGGAMSGGMLDVRGSARDLAGCEMAGGTLSIAGNARDFAASTLPGSMDGMRGGTLVIGGSAGARLGDRMRRGLVVVHGDVGDFAASRLVAGTIAIGGRPGAHGGFGMRRGSVILAGGPAAPAPTFVPVAADVRVAWQLIARDIGRRGGVFAGLASRGIERHLGDLAVDGRGEWIVAR